MTDTALTARIRSAAEGLPLRKVHEETMHRALLAHSEARTAAYLQDALDHLDKWGPEAAAEVTEHLDYWDGPRGERITARRAFGRLGVDGVREVYRANVMASDPELPEPTTPDLYAFTRADLAAAVTSLVRDLAEIVSR